MKYHDYLKTFSQDTHCPFCIFNEKEIIAESKYFLIVASRSPYALDHLLIVSRRHVVFLEELKKAELKELRSLTEEWNAKFHQRHKSTTLLIRDTMSGWGTGKSINHLHLHIVPNRYIGITRDREREFFSDTEYVKEVKRLKKLYG